MQRFQFHPFAVALLLVCIAPSLHAQFKTDLVNWQGATAPCIGIGPIAAPIAKKCVTMFEQAGFLPTDQVGSSGITLDATGKDDSAITQVMPNSPAASSGLLLGDKITAINGTTIAPHPGQLARSLLFGERGQTVHIAFEHNGARHEADLVLAHQNVPEPPKLSAGFMVAVKPIVNWQGNYIPCLGAGPAYLAALEYCYKHFKPFGFVRPDEAGGADIGFDEDNTQSAVVKSVAPGSPAANAGMIPGDRVIEIDKKMISSTEADQIRQLLFGKTGTKIQITLTRQAQSQTANLVLAGKN